MAQYRLGVTRQGLADTVQPNVEVVTWQHNTYPQLLLVDMPH